MAATDNSCSWVGCDKVLIEKTGGRLDSDFHIVDLRLNREVEKVGGILGDRDQPSALTAVGNVLFAIGDTRKIIDEDKYGGEYDLKHYGVSYYDLCSPSEDHKWKPLPAMMLIPRRRNPAVVSLGTKIFVFAGARSSAGDSCFGEYYDTADKDAGWRPVPRPSYVPLERGVCTSDPTNERIICIFTNSNSLFAYYPDKQTPDEQWICLFDHDVYLRRNMAAPSTVADGVLIYYLNDEFTAYDINTNTILQVSWSSRKPFGPRQLYKYTFSYFIHLGNDILCLPVATSVTPNTTNLEFYRFQVHRRNHRHVVFKPLSVHRIELHGLALASNFVPL